MLSLKTLESKTVLLMAVCVIIREVMGLINLYFPLGEYERIIDHYRQVTTSGEGSRNERTSATLNDGHPEHVDSSQSRTNYIVLSREIRNGIQICDHRIDDGRRWLHHLQVHGQAKSEYAECSDI